MSANLIRLRNAAVAAKVETTPGTDAIGGTPSTTDWILAGVDVQFESPPIANPELTGSLDVAASVVGGLRTTITLRCPIRGSGTAGVAPEWGELLRMCCMQQVVTNSAVGAPTALAAGSTTTGTLGLPFSSTAQAYRGMPVVLSGNIDATPIISNYTDTKVATFAETLGSAASTSTNAQIPINVLYKPTSDETVYKNGTIYFYADGMRWRFVGATGTFSLELTSGNIGFIVFTMRAMFLDFATDTLPTGWNPTRPVAPKWTNGKCKLNRSTAQLRSLRVDAGITLTLPDNPESAEGYDPGIPVSRDSSGTMDPLMNSTLSVARFNAFRAGTFQIFCAQIGSSAGNRFAFLMPQVRTQAMRPGEREGLATDEIRFQSEGADAGLFICCY